MIVFTALALTAATVPASADDCADTGVGDLGHALVEHSCFHTEFGPFTTVTATPGTTATAGTPKVDPVHTYYTVRLTPGVPNVVTYMPVRTGTWAAFGDADIPQHLLGPDGVELPVRLSHAIPDCPALPIVRVFALEALTRYTIVFDASTASQTLIVLEKVSDFDTLHGRDRDVDGYGDLADSVTTPCTPPAGYVDDVSDCDDGAPDVHPGADEVCDGRDQNCDGDVDEDVCQITGGGCDAGERQRPPLTMIAALAVAVAGLTRRRRR